MKIIVGCERSQIVARAFRERGHDAYSCDILPCEHPEWGIPHIQDDVLKHLNDGWDMGIFHPPCTYLSYAGTAHWNKPGRLTKRLEALDFFAKLWNAPIEKICIENPAGCASPVIAKYSQEIEPSYFGSHYCKKTWLWLKNLPPLMASYVDPVPMRYVNSGSAYRQELKVKGSARTGEDRARTFDGIARAMAEQWG